MRKDQFQEITKWQKEVFPSGTPLSNTHHLKEEVEELLEDLENNNPNRRLEFADCFILLFGSASADGMTYSDICDAISEKFEIVKKRKWERPDENGVVRHKS